MRMDDFIKRLGAYEPDAEVVGVFWTSDDVIGAACDMGVVITDEEVSDVMCRLEENHDANYGINWEVIMFHIDSVVQERN